MFASGVWVLAHVSGFVVPLIIAAVLGALFVPVVQWLADRDVPTWGGALAVLLFLAGVVLGSTIIGAALAGMLGPALSSPAFAVGVLVHRRLTAASAQEALVGGSSDAVDPPTARGGPDAVGKPPASESVL